MKILITSGGTLEKIDQVRSITNNSTGEMGLKICNELSKIEGVEIYYLNTKTSMKPKNGFLFNVYPIEVNDTQSVHDKMKEIIQTNKIDYVIHAMAISDYKVEKVFTCENVDNALNQSVITNSEDLLNHLEGIDTSSKISSNLDTMFIQLTKTPKIVDLIKEWDSNIRLISFKLLTNANEKKLIKISKNQKTRTRSEVVIGNTINNDGSYKILWVEKKKAKELKNKKEVAKRISKYIQKTYNKPL